MQTSTADVAVPIELVDMFGIKQGYPVERAFHAETGCLISCLDPNVDLFGDI
jgi:hypothetical protein